MEQVPIPRKVSYTVGNVRIYFGGVEILGYIKDDGTFDFLNSATKKMENFPSILQVMQNWNDNH